MIVVNVVLREKKERRKGKIEEDSKNQSINPMSSNKISFLLGWWCLYQNPKEEDDDQKQKICRFPCYALLRHRRHNHIRLEGTG